MLPGNSKQELKLGLSAFLLFTKMFLLNSQDFQPTDAISMYMCCFVSCKTIVGLPQWENKHHTQTPSLSPPFLKWHGGRGMEKPQQLGVHITKNLFNK